MPITRVYVRKWSDGRIDELSISGRPKLIINVQYDADGFPSALEIKGGKLSPIEVFGLLRFADRSMRGFGKGVTYGVLKGEDNTVVSETGAAYVLKKTLILYYVKTENPITDLMWQLGNTGGTVTVYGKITLESPTISETVEDEQNTLATGYNDYYKTFSREYSGLWVKIRVYLHGNGTAGGSNKNCKGYGKTTEEITYL